MRVVHRLTVNGVLDKSFSRDGTAPVPSAARTMAVVQSFDVDADGQIVVASGAVSPAGAVTLVSRLSPRGRAVSGFGTDGWTEIRVDGRRVTDTYQVALDGQGRVLGGGTTTPDGETGFRMFAFRLTATGSLDTRFAGDGTRTIALGSADVAGGYLAQQDNGAVVLAGANPAGSILVVRLTPRGRFDTTFSGDGRSLVSASPDQMSALAVAVAPRQDRASVMVVKGTASPGAAGVVAVDLT
jgi:uncharacterized delta-60 repeat protein